MKISNDLLEITQDSSGGYHALTGFGQWLTAVMNEDYGNDSLKKVEYLEYHAETDEVFILLKGNAALVIAGGKDKPENISLEEMEPLKFYNVKKGVWHAIVFKNGGSVAIVENSDTGRQNSEYYYLNDDEKKSLLDLRR